MHFSILSDLKKTTAVVDSLSYTSTRCSVTETTSLLQDSTNRMRNLHQIVIFVWCLFADIVIFQWLVENCILINCDMIIIFINLDWQLSRSIVTIPMFIQFYVYNKSLFSPMAVCSVNPVGCHATVDHLHMPGETFLGFFFLSCFCSVYKYIHS